MYVFLFSVEYAAIGWHDFVVVETINFREDEAGEIFIIHPLNKSVIHTYVSVHMYARMYTYVPTYVRILHILNG